QRRDRGDELGLHQHLAEAAGREPVPERQHRGTRQHGVQQRSRGVRVTTSVPRRADGGAGRRPLPSARAAVLAGALALAVAAWGAAAWPAWAAGGGVSVEWDGERLTVHADATPHAAILRAVTRRTGVVVQATESALGIVSMHFSTLSLRQALGRLAGGLDHIV